MAATLNQDDIKLLKGVFATKDDLKQFATKEDIKHLEERFDQKLDDMKSSILDGVRSYLESALVPLVHDHEKRIGRIETHLDLPPLPARGQ